ncbi:hypothetical protein [Vibrio harveyi]
MSSTKYDNVSFLLFHDKMVEAHRATNANFVHHSLGEMKPSDFHERFISELPQESFSIDIKHDRKTLGSDYLVNVSVSSSAGVAMLVFYISILPSEWKSDFPAHLFPDVLKDILIDNGVKLISSKQYDSEWEAIEYFYHVQLSDDPHQDLNTNISKRLDIFFTSLEQAVLSLNSLNVQVVKKASVLSGERSEMSNIMPPIVNELLTSPRLVIKVLGVVVLLLLISISIVGMVADFKEVFG